ncbi:uncharacterized protein EURHEDRAFT_452686 [Aspergillus ruber CBS 135680]|uniref:Uncharacterized protein n=1 Tax=Aspergillus ruber (strain CBS 135680) TaxID=1388766 RepID=A0A017SIT4_ASPRC|nr:uncharacterized protein EURHEDRAFT_452686 [Aspergillus ruber CBS 135680]EYE96661.1 hypothetical protein EURHEDRAFT_452686 [Aspergillus ruber CBS 135680]
MSGILLFCTAPVPASVINRLMQDSSIPKHGRNIFSLVRTPDQTTLDNFNSNPPINPFSTGFLSTPDTELRRYTRQRISDLERERSISLSSKWVAVLDERSVTDNTVVIHRYETKSEWEQLQREAEEEWVGIPGTAEINEEEDSIWWKWRVPFDAVFHLYNHVETFSWRGVALWARPEYLGEDGIVMVRFPVGIISGGMEDPLGLM